MYKLFTKDITGKLRIVDAGDSLDDVVLMVQSQKQLRRDFASLEIITKRPILGLITNIDTKTA